MEVQFEENKPMNYDLPPKKGGISNLIMKIGLAKDEAGANKVMLVIIVICIVLAIYLFYYGF
jgi:hypothetical protein